MKYVSLSISTILTVFVFSMSFATGSDSTSLSLSVTNVVADILNNLFPNNTIDFDTLHIVVRKMAHISEYIVLAISWFVTMRLWKGSVGRLFGLGLLIAGIDETIQIFAIDRGSSVWDALLFDFLPFALAGYLLWFIIERKREETMDTTTLVQLQQNAISPEAAYKKMFKYEKPARMPLFRRAHFVKLKIHVPEEKGVNVFLKVLFFIPIPIVFLKIIMSFIKMDKFDDDIPLDKKEIMRMISHRGIKVKVNTKSGEKILIKTI
ncbi:MAG: VanZ family protein [Bacilli bacterium]|nr:VanZ family protein [Bacilli bacterium]MBN2876871.1 VanZ family protein [Bacilli bacterium]